MPMISDVPRPADPTKKKVGRPRKIKTEEETKVEKKEVTKTFECKFYNKELKGCGAKCPKNRNICCYYCPMYARCITIPEIAVDICDQVKEVKC